MSAAAISSRAALPARSPMPLMAQLDLAGAAFDAGEGVGDGHAEIVVAVRGEDDVFDAGDAGLTHAEDRCVLGGRGVADGVWDVDGGGAGLDGDGDHLEEEVGVGAGAVFGGELDVVDEACGRGGRSRRPGRGPARG